VVELRRPLANHHGQFGEDLLRLVAAEGGGRVVLAGGLGVVRADEDLVDVVLEGWAGLDVELAVLHGEAGGVGRLGVEGVDYLGLGVRVLG